MSQVNARGLPVLDGPAMPDGTTNTHPARPRVLIVEENPLVAADIAATVTEVLGNCTIATAPDMAAARSEIMVFNSYNLAIVTEQPRKNSRAQLELFLQEIGCAVVVIADQTEEELALSHRPRTKFVSKPFTTSSLALGIVEAATSWR